MQNKINELEKIKHCFKSWANDINSTNRMYFLNGCLYMSEIINPLQKLQYFTFVASCEDLQEIKQRIQMMINEAEAEIYNEIQKMAKQYDYNK